MSIQTVGLYPVLLSYRLYCCFLPAIKTSCELAGLIYYTLLPSCNLSSASPLPRLQILNLPCTVAYSGLLPSSPMQRSSIWYAQIPITHPSDSCTNRVIHTNPGRNPDRFHSGRRGGMEQGGARNRGGPRVRDRRDARQARHRQPRELQAPSAIARDGRRRGRIRAIHLFLRGRVCASPRLAQLLVLTPVRLRFQLRVDCE